MNKIFLLFTILGLFVSCNEHGYLYQNNIPAADSYAGTFSIKEAQTENQFDLLWVIDNSGSMSTHQQNVIRNTASFVQEFTKRADIDWKVGVISTALSENPYVGFVSDLYGNDPAVIPSFQRAVQALGTSGDATERSFSPIIKALTNYKNFLRPNAYLAIIIVTDAYEQSENYRDAQVFMNDLIRIKGNASKIKIFGAFGANDLLLPNGSKCDNEAEKPYHGEQYERVVQMTGGSIFPICAPDFGAQLSGIAQSIIKLFKNPSIYLSARPDSKSIKVNYLGKDLPGGDQESGGMWYYDYSSNAVVFYNLDFAPALNEKVTISFVEDNGFN